jgi:hypothetical protein
MQSRAFSNQHSAKPYYRKEREGRKGKRNFNPLPKEHKNQGKRGQAQFHPRQVAKK